MSDPLMAQEAVIQARRIFAWLLEDRAWFGPARSQGDVPLIVDRDGVERTVMIIEAPLMKRLADSGWLTGPPTAPKVSAAGHRWYQRACARRAGAFSAETVQMPDGAQNAVWVNKRESPLDWLRRRRDGRGVPLLGAAEYAAGCRLRADFTYAGLSPRMSVDWAAVRVDAAGRDPAVLSDGQLDARQRFRCAIDAAGPECAALLIDICCFLIGLDEAEKKRGWPRRSGRIALSIGLARLARHYQLTPADAKASVDYLAKA